MNQPEVKCGAEYVTKRTLLYTDLVYCSKPAGHRNPEHSFTTTPRNSKGITYRWTDKEGRRD